LNSDKIISKFGVFIQLIKKGNSIKVAGKNVNIENNRNHPGRWYSLDTASLISLLYTELTPFPPHPCAGNRICIRKFDS
jgi:hypothetical protein